MNVTSEPLELSRLISPSVESALIVVPDNSSAVVLPIPVAAFRSIVVAVISPAPLMLPAELIVTVSPDAVVVPVKFTSPLVVVSVTF